MLHGTLSKSVRQHLVWPDVLILWAALVAGKAWLLRRPNQTPMDQLRAASLWVGAVYGIAMAYVLLTRSYYSRSFLLVSLVLVLMWQMIDILLLRPRTTPLRLAAVPSRMMDKLSMLPGLELIVLTTPQLREPVAGIVVDMHEVMSPEWQRFVAESHIPHPLGDTPVFFRAKRFRSRPELQTPVKGVT